VATVVLLGPDGPAAAADALGLGSDAVSNARGDHATLPYGVAPQKGADMIGVPDRGYYREEKPVIFVPNILRDAAAAAVGHHYWYFDTLVYNGIDEAHVYRYGREYLIPARGSGRALSQAAKWRERFGRP
jgi:hypothetical protein